MVSMGFAFVENLMYIINSGYATGFMRMFTAVPAHATFGIIMGYYLGLQKMNGNKWIGIQGLLLAAGLHAAYDFFLLAGNIPGLWTGALLSLLLGIRFSLKAIKLHQEASPFRTLK
jgi:RsiW-degrading membrane proteinase PrsW (M82 family)